MTDNRENAQSKAAVSPVKTSPSVASGMKPPIKRTLSSNQSAKIEEAFKAPKVKPDVILVTLATQQKESSKLKEPECSHPSGGCESAWSEPRRTALSVAREAQVPIPTSNKFDPLRDSNRLELLRAKKKQTKHAASNLSKHVGMITANPGGVRHSSEPEANVGTELPKQYQDAYSYESDISYRRLKCHRINGHIKIGPKWYVPGEVAVAPLSAGVPQAPPLNPVPGFGQDQRALALRRHAHRVAQIAARATVPKKSKSEPPEEMYSQRDEDNEAPGGFISEYRERRMVDVHKFTTYEFPLLDFLGWWNDTPYSRSAAEPFAAHLGVHFHERYVTVRIPGDIVVEMENWWTGKHRDPEGVNYGLSLARCKVLTSEFAITAPELYEANLYAPALGFMLSWENQQNVGRVQTGSYLRSSLAVTAKKNVGALRTKRGKYLAVAGALAIGATLVGAVYAVRRARQAGSLAMSQVLGIWVNRPSLSWPHLSLSQYMPNLALQVNHTFVPAPRLVGVELNPGWGHTFVPAPRLVGVELNPGWGFRPSRHTPTVERPLVNCASLPRPKRLKPKAKISQGTGELRAPLNLKSPLELRGKQCQYGFDSKGYAPHGFASNKHNEEQSLVARVLCDTPYPTEDLTACIKWCKKNWRKIFPHMYEVESVSFEAYLERSNASPSVKRTLRACKARMDADGMSEDSKLSNRQLYQYTYRSSFVKVENDLYSSPYGRKDKAPRLIQGAQPEFICIVGPWIMALQDLLKRRWDTDNFICFTSGVSAEKAANHVMAGRGRWLEDDLGKFDASIRIAWCAYEVWLCKKMGAPRAVLDLMTANISTHGSTHHGWRYKCRGTRKSGDPYTSLMNSIVNGLSHLYLYCQWTNKTVDQARDSLRMLVQGDDNCMRHAERTSFPWREGMAGLGFDSEAVYRSHPNEVEFCSCRLYLVEEGFWVFGPKPGRVLAKFGYIINPPANVSRESMMRGVALGLKKGCSFIPPINKVIERVLQLTHGHKAWFERKQFAPFAEEPLKPKVYYATSVDVMLNLNMNYDWDYGKQAHFDARVSQLELGDSLGSYSELLFDRDTSGPQTIFGGWVPQQRPEPISA